MLFADFGLERLIDVAERTNFPWLMSNVEDNETGCPLAGGILTHTINWHGWKIGLVGQSGGLVVLSCDIHKQSFSKMVPL